MCTASCTACPVQCSAVQAVCGRETGLQKQLGPARQLKSCFRLSRDWLFPASRGHGSYDQQPCERPCHWELAACGSLRNPGHYPAAFSVTLLSHLVPALHPSPGILYACTKHLELLPSGERGCAVRGGCTTAVGCGGPVCALWSGPRDSKWVINSAFMLRRPCTDPLFP